VIGRRSELSASNVETVVGVVTPPVGILVSNMPARDVQELALVHGLNKANFQLINRNDLRDNAVRGNGPLDRIVHVVGFPIGGHEFRGTAKYGFPRDMCDFEGWRPTAISEVNRYLWRICSGVQRIGYYANPSTLLVSERRLGIPDCARSIQIGGSDAFLRRLNLLSSIHLVDGRSSGGGDRLAGKNLGLVGHLLELNVKQSGCNRGDSYPDNGGFPLKIAHWFFAYTWGIVYVALGSLSVHQAAGLWYERTWLDKWSCGKYGRSLDDGLGADFRGLAIVLLTVIASVFIYHSCIEFGLV
jgi:hypothetical protein